ncbi:DSC E3 ubiquitin ligase complex subunit 1 [Ceratobasidium sp. AG-Ba]|nr:DSC E3 ubiquitin ligase complex subunit 1 [Ceratobasidium sp. AG-Ba]
MEAPLPGATATTPFNPNQARSSVTSLLLISIVLFLLSGDDPSLQAQKEDTLRSLEYQQGNYTAWLNGTASNFTLEDTTNLTSPIVNALIPKRAPIDPSQESYYTNITGFINGPASFYNLSNPRSSNDSWNWDHTAKPLVSSLNQTKVRSRLGEFDWLGIDKIAGNVREQKLESTSTLSFLTGHIDFVNSKDDVLVNYQLDGVHFYEDGTIYGLMEPRGLDPDLRQLSPLVPSNVRNLTAYAIKDEIERQIHVLQDRIKNPRNDGQSEDRNSITTCSFQLYARIRSSNFSTYLMQELEAETEDPTGVRTVKRPPLQLDGLILSPDCAVALRFNEAVGMQANIFWQKSTMYSFVASLCYFIILKLLVRQMEMSRTPSSIAKISRWTFAFQAIADAYSFVGHVTVGIVSESRSSLSIIAPGFLAATLFLVFEVRFSMLIHQIQGPEDAVMRTPAAPATPNTTTPEVASDQASTAPAAAARTEQVENTLARLRHAFGVIQAFTNSMTDPDSKFCKFRNR